jgi:hypothetical protein
MLEGSSIEHIVYQLNPAAGASHICQPSRHSMRVKELALQHRQHFMRLMLTMVP